jgi:hypothetical protein
MKAVFQRYIDAEAEAEEEDEAQFLDTPTRQKLPGGDYHDERYVKTCSVDTSLLTGTRSYKKQRKTTELQQYYDTLAADL